MNPATLERAQRLEPRAVVMAAGGTLLLVLLAGWFYVLKPVLGEYRSLGASRAQAEQDAQLGGVAVDARALDAMAERIAGLEATLREGGADDADETLPELMSVLAALATRHRVDLGGVKPAAVVRAPGFEEQPFDIEASGRYFDVVAWLHAAETQLAPLTVGRFELREGDEDGAVALRLRMSAWRLPEQP